jgi:hypothetical protein
VPEESVKFNFTENIFISGRNFIAQIIWQKKLSPQNDVTYFSNIHDYILCYAKNNLKQILAEGESYYQEEKCQIIIQILTIMPEARGQVEISRPRGLLKVVFIP